MSRHFSIDSFAARNGRVFGWGWFLDTELRMERGELRVPVQGGGEAVMTCIEGAARPDVEAAFPGVDHAAACGFMLMGEMRGAIDPGRPARFTAWLEDGDRHDIEIATLPGEDLPLQVSDDARHVLRRVRALGMRGTLQAVRRRLRRRLDGGVQAMRRAWLRIARPPMTVVFDHGMGGGANLYRDRRVEALLAEGRRVALVTPQIASLDCALRVVGARGEIARWPSLDEAALCRELDGLNVAAVEVNNLVGFVDVPGLVAWCVRAHRRGAHLTFHLHDFHAVCPAFTLIDANGRYCGVPSLDVCRGCLPMNAANSLGLGVDMDVADWRRAWSMLLEDADEVIAFSDASVRILERAYPALAGRLKLAVRPHESRLDHLRPVRRTPGDVLKIAVIGNISRPKGADIVRGIARAARERALPVQVVVLGTLQTAYRADAHLVVHGAFVADELPELMEKYGIDACLVPSICPETYSFVTDEIMAMDMPIAVFDIGAPAERVARYPRGAVVTDITAEAALDAIIRLAGRDTERPQTNQEHP